MMKKYLVYINDNWGYEEIRHFSTRQDAEKEISDLYARYIIRWNVINKDMVYRSNDYCFVSDGIHTIEFILESRQ